MLSQHVQRTYASELLESGAAGYLLKQRVTDSRTFCSDVRRISAGASILDPEVVATMLALRQTPDDHRRVLAVVRYLQR